MSTFNWDVQYTYHYVDQENKMVLTQDPDWKVNGDNGKRDSIGRTKDAYYAWGDERFIEGIESCWEKVERKGWLKRLFLGKYYYQGYRYPTKDHPVGLSRDHLTNTVLAYILAGKSQKEIWEFVKHLRWRISDFAVMTPDLWLWLRAVSGRKFWTHIFYIVQYLVFNVTVWWQKIIQSYSGIGPDYEEPQDEFHYIQNSFKPKIVTRFTGKLYPVYALKIAAWQISVLKNKKWKKRLQKVLLKIVPKHNYFVQLLLDDPNGPSEEQVMNYKPMKSGRWSGILNVWWNDRSIQIIPKGDPVIDYNVLDVDILRKLWKDKNNESA